MNIYKVWLAGGKLRYIQASFSFQAERHASKTGRVESVTLCDHTPINVEIEVAS